MKEKNYRRSLRQTEILMQLDEKPARTITELAERMNAQRPSISRSLRLLKEQGIVFRDRKGWQLTETGKDEASSARDALIESREKIKNITVRTNEVFGRMHVLLDTTKRIEALTPSLGSSAALVSSLDSVKMFNKTSAALASSLGSPAAALVASSLSSSAALASSLNSVKMIGEVIKPLLKAQERNSILLGNLTTPTYLAGIDKIVKQNNLYLANAIDNILTIRQTEMAQFAAQVSSSIDFSWVSTHLINVNRSYEQLFSHYLEKIDIPDLSTISLSSAEEIILPTATVAYYSDSLRDLVKAETEADIPPLPAQGFEEVGDQTLDSVLYELSPDFVEMRLGSWSVLQIGGPDRLRQAATSQRELLTQLLQFFVPNIQLPEDKRQGPQIKARVRIALETSNSDAEFIEAVVQAVYTYYNQLNKYTHHNKKHEESLVALLRTGEGLIRFILAKTDEKSN